MVEEINSEREIKLLCDIHGHAKVNALLCMVVSMRIQKTQIIIIIKKIQKLKYYLIYFH